MTIGSSLGGAPIAALPLAGDEALDALTASLAVTEGSDVAAVAVAVTVAVELAVTEGSDIAAFTADVAAAGDGPGVPARTDWKPSKAAVKRFQDYQRQLEAARTKDRQEREAAERRILESIEKAYQDITEPGQAQALADAVLEIAPEAMALAEAGLLSTIDWSVFAGDLDGIRALLALVAERAAVAQALALAQALTPEALALRAADEADIEFLLLAA